MKRTAASNQFSVGRSVFVISHTVDDVVLEVLFSQVAAEVIVNKVCIILDEAGEIGPQRLCGRVAISRITNFESDSGKTLARCVKIEFSISSVNINNSLNIFSSTDLLFSVN